MPSEQLERMDIDQAHQLMSEAKARVETVVIGKSEAVELALVAFLAGGHVLVEDLPGTGKTTLAKTIAGTLGCGF